MGGRLSTFRGTTLVVLFLLQSFLVCFRTLNTPKEDTCIVIFLTLLHISYLHTYLLVLCQLSHLDMICLIYTVYFVLKEGYSRDQNNI